MKRALARRRLLGSLVLFVVATVTYVALGLEISHAPPRGIDLAARTLAGHATSLAWIFTESCRWPTLTELGLIGIIVAWRVRAWRARIVFSLIVMIVGWQTSDLLKNLFGRVRPTYWYIYHEPSLAYSSGHAMFATIVYGLWAYHAARSDAPPALRMTLGAFSAAWGCGVIWSRLALGAHYPSDLLGGIVLGVALLALGNTIATIVAPDKRVL